MKNKIYNLLRWSERYTKTDMVYLAKGGSWLTGGQIISSAATFLLAIAFANLLPKETYGTYQFVLSIAAILAIPTLAGMSTAVTQAVARGYEDTISPALKTRLRWGTLAAIASIATAGYYFVQGNETLTISFLIAAVFLPLMDAFNLYDSYLNGKKEFGKVSRYNVYIKIASVATLATAVFFTDNLFIILLAYFVPYTIMRYVFLQVTLRKLPPNDKIDGGAIRYGKHLSLMGIISKVANHLDKVLLFHFLGAAPVAIYSIATAPPEQIKGMLKNINALALPRFSNRPLSSIRSEIFKKMKIMGFFIAVGVIFYVLLAPTIFNIFFPTYESSIQLSQIYILSVFGVVSILPKTALEAHKGTRELYWIRTLNPIIAIVLLVVFVLLWGLIGVIVARVLFRFINIGVASFFLARKKHVK